MGRNGRCVGSSDRGGVQYGVWNLSGGLCGGGVGAGALNLAVMERACSGLEGRRHVLGMCWEMIASYYSGTTECWTLVEEDALEWLQGRA